MATYEVYSTETFIDLVEAESAEAAEEYIKEGGTGFFRTVRSIDVTARSMDDIARELDDNMTGVVKAWWKKDKNN